jgi:hypothetical protein
MSLVVKMMIVGWIATLAMIGCCALNESGKLLKIRKSVGSWLETFAARAVGTRRKPLIRRHERGLTCTRRIDAADS